MTVRFRPRPAGFRHAVYFRLGDGRRLMRVVPGKRRAYRLCKVGRGVTGTVTVQGLTALNFSGPKAGASLRAAGNS